MPNYSPGNPPLDLIRIGDKWISRDHVAAVLPGRIRDNNSNNMIDTLRVELAGGQGVLLRGEEIDAVKNYLGWWASYNPETVVDVMWIWGEAKKEEAAKRAEAVAAPPGTPESILAATDPGDLMKLEEGIAG